MDILQTIKQKSEELAKTRRTINKIDEEYKRVVTPYQEAKKVLEDELLTLLRENDLKSIKAETGETFTRSSRKDIAVVDEVAAVDWAKSRNLVKVDLTRAKAELKLLPSLPEGFEEKETEYMSVRGVKE